MMIQVFVALFWATLLLALATLLEPQHWAILGADLLCCRSRSNPCVGGSPYRSKRIADTSVAAMTEADKGLGARLQDGVRRDPCGLSAVDLSAFGDLERDRMRADILAALADEKAEVALALKRQLVRIIDFPELLYAASPRPAHHRFLA